jgi:hypothetical protein
MVRLGMCYLFGLTLCIQISDTSESFLCSIDTCIVQSLRV